ncbi:MAG: LysM peptidoglycan-binding domain-containing protein [Anaerolineales bacterium]
MSKKLYGWMAFTLVVGMVLTGCVKSAAPAPLTTATPTSLFGNVAGPTSMNLVQLYGTQTAMAMTTPLGTPTPQNGTPNPLTPQPLPTLTLYGVLPTGVYGTPATVAPIVVPTATPGRPVSYTLQSGEYPYCIARRFNVDPAELTSANNLTSGQLLQPGVVLTIPQTGDLFPGTRALHAHPSTYTVSNPQDNIYKIACYYGDVSPDEIAYANSLVAPYTVNVGQVLNIP